MSSATKWMDLEIIILSKKEKDKYHDITYMWSLKYMTQMNLCAKQKQVLRQNTNSWLPKGEKGGEGQIGGLG